MRKIINTSAFLIAGILLLQLFIIPIAAIGSGNGQGSTGTQQNGQSEDSAAQLGANRCERVSNRLQYRAELYESNQNRYQERYSYIQGIAEDIVDELSESGYDTSQLENDLVQLRTMTQTFASNYTEAVSTMNQIREGACGENRQQFEEGVVQTRERLQILRNDAEQIRTYLKETIRQDLVDLKTEVEANQ